MLFQKLKDMMIHSRKLKDECSGNPMFSPPYFFYLILCCDYSSPVLRIDPSRSWMDGQNMTFIVIVPRSEIRKWVSRVGSAQQ